MRDESAHLHQHAVESTRGTAHRLQLRLSSLIAASETLAHALGGIDATNPTNGKRCSQALASALRAGGASFRNYTLTDPSGNVLCTAAATAVAPNIGDRVHFQKALDLKRPVLSAVTAGRIVPGSEPLLLLAVPILGEQGAVTAMVSIAIRTAGLAGELVDPDHAASVALVLDSQGQLVNRSPARDGVGAGRSYADTPLFRHALAGSKGPQEITGMDGTPRLYVTSPVMFHGEPVLWVAAGFDVAQLQAAARAEHLRRLLWALLLAAVVVVVAVAATRPLVLARMRNLLQVAAKVAQGDYRQRVPVVVRDDLSPVEDALNHMLQAVADDLAALQASEARYRMLFENSLDGVLETTPDGRVLSANPAACELLGRDAQSITRLTRDELVDPADARLGPLVRQRAEQGWARGELRMLRADGSPIEVEVSSSIFSDSRGGVRTCVFIHDVTERRQAQEQILQMNRELEARVHKRTQELQAANRELEAFSYSVSHDLRAPAGVVEGFSSVLETNGAVTGAKNQHYLRRIRAAGRHMNELIDGLLALSTVSRSHLDWSLVNLSDLAHDAVQELREREPDRQVTVDLAPGMHSMGDARLLRVVLANLIGNAWKFTCGKPHAHIAVGLRPATEGGEGEGGGASAHDASPVYCVTDNGDGFDPAHAARLFLPFHRLHTAEEFPGLGIGLATVQRIVQRHGGRIWAHATPGKGASFFFTLGAAAMGGAPAAPAASALPAGQLM